MKNQFFAIVISFVFLVTAQTVSAETKSTENLSSLMGALGQAINNRTEIPGTNEAPAKLTPPAEKVLETLENDLELCQTTKSEEPESMIVEKDGVKVEFKKFDLRINGDKCPLEVNVSVQATEQTADKLIANFKMSVVFKTEAYQQKYKMKFVEASGAISAHAQKTGTIVKVPVNVTIASRGESLDLGLFSQSIAMDATIEADLAAFQFGVLVEQKADMSHSGKTEKGYSRSKMSGFSQPEVYFSINDKEVSSSEFQTFMQTFVIPGMVSEEDPNAPGAKVSSQCTYAAYDKKLISVSDLKSQMQNSTFQSEGRLAAGQSCSKNLNVPFKHDGLDYSGNLNYGAEWVSFGAASMKDPQATSSSVYVLYGDEAIQTKETETVIMGLQCKAVPVCQ